MLLHALNIVGRLVSLFGGILNDNLVRVRRRPREGNAHEVTDPEPRGVLEGPGHHDDVGAEVLLGENPQRRLPLELQLLLEGGAIVNVPRRLAGVLEPRDDAVLAALEVPVEREHRVLAHVDARGADEARLFEAGVGQRPHLGVDALCEHLVEEEALARRGWK